MHDSNLTANEEILQIDRRENFTDRNFIPNKGRAYQRGEGGAEIQKKI